MKYKNNLQLKQWIDLIDSSTNEDENVIKVESDQNEIKVESKNGDNGNDKENKNQLKINDFFNKKNQTKIESTATAATGKDSQVKFTITDVKISEVIMNCVKDFTGPNEQDFTTVKINGDQLDKIKFFRLNDRQVELGSRWKLELTEQHQLVDFKEYQDYLNENIKLKILNLPRQMNVDLTDYTVEVNECYEKERISKSDNHHYMDLSTDLNEITID